MTRGEKALTVAQGADAGEHGRVEDATVVVEADHVQVHDKGRLASLNQELLERQDVGTVKSVDRQRVPISLAERRVQARSVPTDAARMSFSRLDNTCASSAGGPGRKLAEHRGGRSMLGTACNSERASATTSCVVALIEIRAACEKARARTDR